MSIYVCLCSIQACKVGNYRVAEMLIFYGAELDYQSNTGATPLHVSAFNNEVSDKMFNYCKTESFFNIN